ncbi:hypothetical protein MLD38_003312 [Melastoma candidum]|uniref:Uncharacterized protein n=1 Tax=Melastoma candidum TaxID=119954 RepID=A0ACB9S2V1_9MYRT|nr:hypothetical protein MLD38_003312 [Melastoma candidum]
MPSLPPPFIFLLLLLLFSSSAASSSAPAAEQRALLALKSSVVSDSSSSLSPWTPPSPANSTAHCSWPFVSCDPLRHRVTSLDLSSLNLSSPFPPSLSLLPHLAFLNLSNNLFDGSLPSSFFAALPSLHTLDLYNNNLSGPLPPAPLPSRLRHLHLGGNFFSGPIPVGYSLCDSLEYLALSGNELTGTIPPQLGNLSRLRELYVGYYNVFDGGLPPELGNLSELVRLDAASCGLSGEIPPELGKLKKLDTLFLQVNLFSGGLTPELGTLQSLKSMDLSNNLLTGEIPASFADLKNLTLLNLFRNRLYGSIPEFIGELPQLEVIQLWENNFTGNIPANLGSNGNLQLLDVSSNKLNGVLPPDLCEGNQLHTLITLGNFFFGPIPESLGKCWSLSRLRMGDNFFNGSIPTGLFGLPMLTQVELQDNYLEGEFVVGDSAATNLGQINLSNNRMSGPLPAAIGNFSGVQKLLLNGNRFSGRIPPEIGLLQQLSKMDFSNNEFSGEITPEISQCKTLTFVDLSRNNFSGEIPNDITTMRILNYLNLSRNHLDGSIPASIASMQSLTSVDFSYNNLSGLVPGTGQFSYFNSTSFLGNPDLCGPYLGPCSDASTNGINKLHGKGHLSSSVKLLLVIGLLLCSIMFAIAAIIKARSLKKASNARAWKLTAFQRLDFTSDDLLDCLKEDNIIGKGGAGIVYKGVMPNGDLVAVKRLAAMSRGSSHDHGFNAEIQTLGKIRHRHIVRLLGFCSNHETNLLVYEYMPNGSLGEVLHGKKGGHLLWETRYKIALEAAKGLCYLHHDCSPLIVHRDVKSNNILLDSNLEAHVADFGLAKFLQDSGASECMSVVAGSYGYIAPEYAYTLKVDEKSDVYSFGVVLLELVSGRRPVGEFGDGVDIVQWVRKTTGWNKDEVHKILDQRLSSVPIQEVTHVFYVALLCVEEQAVERPTMREVVQMLAERPNPIVTIGSSPPQASTTTEHPTITHQSPPPDLLSS